MTGWKSVFGHIDLYESRLKACETVDYVENSAENSASINPYTLRSRTILRDFLASQWYTQSEKLTPHAVNTAQSVAAVGTLTTAVLKEMRLLLQGQERAEVAQTLCLLTEDPNEQVTDVILRA